MKTLRSQLEVERPDREEVEGELSDLRQKSKNDAARKNFPDFPEPADLLNKLKARRKKSRADLADMEAVLDILASLGT
ncbi:hypothetical protein [Microcoleus sp. D3_18a_C4]|uniref:hypothetical protein n=1 Tax=unclassified Microcoleus TaxID=2642155 RepID=UPI002FD26E1C